MNISLFLTSLFIALAMAGWPIIGKFSKASPGWIGAGVNLIAALVVILLARKEIIHIPSSKAIWLLVGAGIVNGIAIWLYASRIADPKVPAAIFLVITAVLVAVWAPILDWLLNGAVPSGKNIIGYFVAAIAIYLLSK